MDHPFADRRRLLIFLLRLMAALVVLAGLFALAGEYLARGLLPLCSSVFHALRPDYAMVRTAYVGSPDGAVLEFIVQVAGRFPGAGRTVYETLEIGSYIAAGMVGVPWVLALAPLLAWPGLRPTRRWGCLALAIGLLVAFTALDLPLVLAEKVDLEVARLLKLVGPEGWYAAVMNDGGRHFVALVIFLLCLGLARHERSTATRRL